MKPNHLPEIAHQGNVRTESATSFGFDNASLPFLMSILTDMYSDQAGAVLREYSTNAWDSHIEAGVTDPIEITLPTRWNSTLVIRDHGIGMDLDGIRRTYGLYGFSSKRDDDTQNGMLGLGSKSALTYTSQFTVTARKDGMQITCLITRDGEGVGMIQPIGDPVPTEERNGVEITIPVKDVWEMQRKSAEFFQYWPKGSVLVDGEEPESVFDRKDALVIDPDVILIPAGQYARSKVIMSNVAYPMDLGGDAGEYWTVVARVPTGSVAFTPSREALMMTPLTNDTLESVRDFVNAHYKRLLQEQLDACETPLDAIRMYHASKPMQKFKCTYRGLVIKKSTTANGWRWDPRYTSRASQVKGSLRFLELAEARLVVTNAPRPTGTMKEKALKFCNDREVGPDAGGHTNSTGYKYIYFLDDNPTAGWLDTITVPWEQIKAVVLPKVDRERIAQPKTKYRIVRSGNYLAYVDDLDAYDRLVHVPARGMDSFELTALSRYVGEFQHKTAIVSLLKHKRDRFFKDFPHAMTPTEMIAEDVASVAGFYDSQHAWVQNARYNSPSADRAALAASPDVELTDFCRLIGVLPPDEDERQARAVARANHNLWVAVDSVAASFGVDRPTADRSTERFVKMYQRVRERYPWLFNYYSSVPDEWLLKEWYNHLNRKEAIDQMLIGGDYVIPVDLTRKTPKAPWVPRTYRVDLIKRRR